MQKQSNTKTYLFTENTTVEMEPGVYGLMPDTETRPLLLAWALDPALGGAAKLLEVNDDLEPRPAIGAVPGHEAVFAAIYDPRTKKLHVEDRPYKDALIASGAALALLSSFAKQVQLSDIIPVLDPVDEKIPARHSRHEYSHEEG